MEKFQVLDKVQIKERYVGAGLIGVLRREHTMFPGTWLIALQLPNSIKLEWRDDSAFIHVLTTSPVT